MIKGIYEKHYAYGRYPDLKDLRKNRGLNCRCLSNT